MLITAPAPKLGYVSVEILADTLEGRVLIICSAVTHISITLTLPLYCFTDAKKPAVAAIDGLALGGGLEVAMVSSLFSLESRKYDY